MEPSQCNGLFSNRRRRRLLPAQIPHWCLQASALDEQLQLHPLAYEAAGQGTWTGGTSSVPTTKPEDQLGIPNGVDRDHPRLEPRRTMMDSGAEDPLMNQSLRDGKVPGCYAAETTYPEP